MSTTDVDRIHVASLPRTNGAVHVDVCQRAGQAPWLQLSFIVPNGHALFRVNVEAGELGELVLAMRRVRGLVAARGGQA